MTDTISRNDAIDRMKAGLPCETCSATEWFPTRWEHFDPPYSHSKFRIPPEPRREGRTYWIHECDEGRRVHKVKLPMCPACTEVVHVREVMPDEVWVKKMTGTEVEDMAWNVFGYERGSSGADELVTFARALGLLKDEDALRGDKP